MKEISAKDLKKLMSRDPAITLLDCRGPDYFAWEHIVGARNIRWKYVAERAPKMFPDKNQLIVTHCESFLCDVSHRAYHALEDLGYKNLIEFSGGISDWKAHGFATETDVDHRISTYAYRFPNQKFYESPVGSYLVEDDEFILIIDGPQTLSDDHEDFIASFGKPIKIFLTHGSTMGDAKILQEKYKAKIYLHAGDKTSEWLKIKPDNFFEKDFDLSKNLRVIHTPGHSPGSSCVLDNRSGILFVGDHTGGMKSGRLRSPSSDSHALGPVSQRLESSKNLLQYDFSQIWPFHYEPIKKDAKKEIEEILKKGDV